MSTTTYTASLTNGTKHVKVVFDETSDHPGDLLLSAWQATTEEDLDVLGEDDATRWVEEIRNTLTDGLVYFYDHSRCKDLPENVLAGTPAPNSECVTA